MFKSIIWIDGVKGSTAKEKSTVIMMIAGAMTKTGLSANGGIQSSFIRSLIVSAITWSSPNGPTLFGPYLSCQSASSRRSTQIRFAAIVIATNRTPTTMIQCINVSLKFLPRQILFAIFPNFPMAEDVRKPGKPTGTPMAPVGNVVSYLTGATKLSSIALIWT
jgi:hypothetical protein